MKKENKKYKQKIKIENKDTMYKYSGEIKYNKKPNK